MAHLHQNLLFKGSGQEFLWRCGGMLFCNKTLILNNERRRLKINRGFVRCCTSSSSSSSTSTSTSTSVDQQVKLDADKLDSRINEDSELEFGYLVRDVKWQVRRMVETEEEMRQVASVQAQAFHQPLLLFNDMFLDFFKIEVYSGLRYRLRNSPPDRYACLVAEPRNELQESEKELAGVVDVTVLNEDSVLQHLLGAKEYIYVSGIAVLNRFRRQKVATALLKACETLSTSWGFDYLVLRAYEDDHGARKLYSNAGYRVVSGDPPWTTSWIGRRRRVLMVKQNTSNILHHISNSNVPQTL